MMIMAGEKKKESGKKEKKKAAPKKKPAAKKEGAPEKAAQGGAETKASAPPKVMLEKSNSATQRKARKARKKKGKGAKTEHARGKRKRAIARATVSEGEGRIRINSRLTSSIGNRYFRQIVEEPLALLGPEGLSVDVSVKVRGGGETGQAQACRTAIARALAQYFGEGVAAKYKEDDTYLLREDPRRVESKKYKGPKARARFQKSYR